MVAVCRGSGGGRSLLFNGHIDVIPEGAPENWEHGPWSGDIAGGRLYGRGASDMKAGVAAMTMAMAAVLGSGIRLRGDVILEYVMDEELTGNGTLACVMRGYRADAGICCETSSMCVQPGSIGRIWYEISVKGKAAGIQRRYEGVNGIDLGFLVRQAVEAYEKFRLETVRHPLYPVIEEAISILTMAVSGWRTRSRGGGAPRWISKRPCTPSTGINAMLRSAARQGSGGFPMPASSTTCGILPGGAGSAL